MQGRRVYWSLLCVIGVAAVVLGYYTYQTASQYESLGARSIAQSLVLLLEQKVDRVESQIIRADNAAFEAANVDDLRDAKDAFLMGAAKEPTSVRSFLVLDHEMNTVVYATRAGRRDSKNFFRVFQRQLLPLLDTQTARLGELKHLHTLVDGRNYLLSYKTQLRNDQRYLLVLQHDVGHIVRETLPMLLKKNEGGHLFNVVDESNRRVYGVSLTDAGVYVVGKRFPTTLYGWRLQAAPKQAPQLEAKGRTRRFNEVALILLAFTVIVAGMGLLVYVVEKERKLNTLKTEFLANVSHELKTPLSVVRMFAEMLLSNRVANEEKRQQYLEMIGQESERLSTLIENVLDFSAIESKKRKYELIEGDIAETVSRAVETFRHRVEREGMAVELHISNQVPRVRFDDQAIMLAVINLLDNAAKYGREKVDVHVAPKGKYVEIYVRDKGEGIPPEDLRRVFERFYRTGKHPQVRGSGIGLSLVKYIADGHAGRVWAKNVTGGGAEVGLGIPIDSLPFQSPNVEEYSMQKQLS